MPAFTICLPHKRNAGNDKALAICLSCLLDNTKSSFKLIVDAAYNQPLNERINQMVRQADTKICVYMASDTFVAPNWAEPMLARIDEMTFVTGVLVDSGVFPPLATNVTKDFGKTPETFNREAFEAWIQGELTQGEPSKPDGEGWVCPYMFDKFRYLELGGLGAGLLPGEEFNGADTELFDIHKANGGRVVRVSSYAYHLERYSDIGQQQDIKRRT